MGPCGRWKDGVVWIVGREAGAAAAAAQSAGEYVGGVWPLSPRAAPGPAGYQEPGIFFFFFWPGLWPRTNMYVLPDPSVDCPRGPGPGAQPRRFQNGIRSTALPRGGREGAGRGGGPASWAALRWALASSCLCCCECGEQ